MSRYFSLQRPVTISPLMHLIQNSIDDIDRRTKGFRDNFSAKTKKLRVQEEEGTSAGNTKFNMELPERHDADPKVEAREWVSIPTAKHPLAGYALQKDSLKAIAVDPVLLYPYSRKDVKDILNIIFFSAAIIAFATGILLWIVPLFSVVWSVVTLTSLVLKALTYIRFLAETLKEVLALRKGHLIWPARGTHAPRTSVIDPRVEVKRSRVQESALAQERSESPTPMFDDLWESADTNDGDSQTVSEIMRRQTTGFEVHAENETSRRPVREDTESNIGLDSTSLYAARLG